MTHANVPSTRPDAFVFGIHAIEARRLDRLKQIVEAFPDLPHARSSHSRSTLLLLAAGEGYAQGFEFLLPLSDPAARDASENTALMRAAYAGCLEIAKMASAGCSGLEVNAKGRNALMCVFDSSPSARQKLSLAEFLLPLTDPSQLDSVLHRNTLGNVCAGLSGAPEAPEFVSLLLKTHDAALTNFRGRGALYFAADSAFEDARLFPLIWERLDLSARIAQTPDAFDAAVWSSNALNRPWGALDAMAPFAARDKAQALFEAGGPEKMPQWAARLEAEAITEAMNGSRGGFLAPISPSAATRRL